LFEIRKIKYIFVVTGGSIWALLLLLNRSSKRRIMSNVAYYTEEGLKRLKDELYDMKTVQRPKISEQIAEARDKGTDGNENC
jgi:Transcription elongation factor, N-terminal